MIDRIVTFWETTKHKLWVMWYISKACAVLLKRGIKHDLSKYSKTQEPYFRKYGKKLKKLTYGSPEYKENMELLKPAIDDHYRKERHHPEHYKDTEDWLSPLHRMSTFDIIEMLCDWRAATRRHSDSTMKKSLDINAKRFDYDEVTKSILLEICEEIGLLD